MVNSKSIKKEVFMKKAMFLILCSSYICIQASDTEEGDLPKTLILPSEQNEVHLNMDQLTESLPKSPTARRTSSTPFTNTKDVAQYLTQIAHGNTIIKPTFLTEPVRQELKRIKLENPERHERILSQLVDHKTTTSRSINITGATQALQQEITPEMVELFINAWESHNTQQTGTITEAEQQAKTDRIKIWCALGTTLLGVIGTVVAAAVGGTTGC
jgi:hypothetical protein